MSLLDGRANLVKVLVDGEHDAVTTSVLLQTAEGGEVPNPASVGQFNMTWWDLTSFPDPSDDPNVEIVRITAKSGDTLTLVRAQEGTIGTTKSTPGHSYAMVLSPTKKLVDDLERYVTTNEGSFVVTAGAANAYTATLPATLSAYPTGMTIVARIHAANSGASTININSLGVKDIKVRNGVALTAGDLPLNSTVLLAYDGTDFHLIANEVPPLPSAALITLTDNATATTLGVINTPVKMAGTYSASDLTDFTHLLGALTYTGPSGRKFGISISCSVSSASSNKQLTIYGAKNGAALATYKNERFYSTAADSGSLSMLFFVTLNNGDYIEGFIENNSGATNATVKQLQITLQEVR